MLGNRLGDDAQLALPRTAAKGNSVYLSYSCISDAFHAVVYDRKMLCFCSATFHSTNPQPWTPFC